MAAQVLDPALPRKGPYVDKEDAKGLARTLAPGIRTAKTLAILSLTPGTGLKDLERFLGPFLGRKCVVKPTHASGTVLLLDRLRPGDLGRFFRVAKRDFFFISGERQYRDLPRKILVEESLAPSGSAPPPDYRFHCAKGVPFFGAVDEGRFMDLKEYHFTVPDFQPVFLQAQGNLPDRIPTRPLRFKEMLRLAAKLSKPFEYVRIDLYLTPRGIHFGEFTFTPMAGLFKFKDPDFSKWLLARALDPRKKVPLPGKWRVRVA